LARCQTLIASNQAKHILLKISTCLLLLFIWLSDKTPLKLVFSISEPMHTGLV